MRMRIDMCVGMFIGMCIDLFEALLCVDMCTDMPRDMHVSHIAGKVLLRPVLTSIGESPPVH